jgi:branched-chain amino acid transport system permease protein
MSSLYIQAAVAGVADGGIYALVAVGITQIFTVTRILNFAQAGFALWGAYLYSWFSHDQNWPVVYAAVVSVALVSVLGIVAELAVFRYAARASNVNKTIMTFGMLLFLTALATWQFGFTARRGTSLMPEGGFQVLGTSVTWQQLSDLVAVALVVIGVEAFLRLTRSGLLTRATAEDATISELLGVSKNRIGRLNWTVAAAIGGLAGVLIAAGQPFDSTTFLQFFLIGVVGSFMGGLRSLLMTALGGIALGVLLLETGVASSHVGLGQLIIFVGVAAYAMLKRKWPAELATAEWSRPRTRTNQPRIVVATCLLLLIGGWVWLVYAAIGQDFWAETGALMLVYAVTGLSLVPLVGWTGQISLAQGGFMGIGGYTFAVLYGSKGWSFPLAVIAAMGAGAVAGGLVGLITRRLSFVLTTIVTLAFTAAAAQWLLYSGFFDTEGGQVTILPPPFMDTGRKAMIVFAVASVVIALLLWNLRRSHWGLQFFAVRTAPAMARHFGISPGRVRVAAFTVSGAIASIAGVMYVLLVSSVSPTVFGVGLSLQVLLYGVLGGLTSLAGPFIGPLAILGIPQALNLARYGSSAWPNLITGAGVMQVTATNPEGLLTAVKPTPQDQARVKALITRRGSSSRSSPRNPPIVTPPDEVLAASPSVGE